MKVLVIGNGGREHTICWKLSQSRLKPKLYCAPGNGGINQFAKLVPIKPESVQELKEFALSEKIDLIIVGPELPLGLGIADQLQAVGLQVFGPTKAAAEIETSKAYAKSFMTKYNIPTADYCVFDDQTEAVEYVKRKGVPIVIKTDGLKAGKGVVVAHELDAAITAIKTIFADSTRDRQAKVVIEEFMDGEELSLMAFVDGEEVVPLQPAQDHKPVFDHDKGPNTGGMGAYSPVPQFGTQIIDQAVNQILLPTAKGLVEENRSFTGILYAGLMVRDSQAKVVEFNARFGDPETQVVLPRMETDLLEIFLACVEHRLDNIGPIKWNDQAIVAVILASEGYPRKYPTGMIINGLEKAEADPDSFIFHAGTKKKENSYLTNGGRVLAVAGKGTDLITAQNAAYQTVGMLNFTGMHYRKDIAAKAMNHMAKLEKLKQQFIKPADEFSPLPFWFWNDSLSETEIIKQIHDFKEKGVMGFIIHPRIGIPKNIEYLSDKFMQYVECAVATAAELGMKVVLYDEGMYPSGSAHGKVVEANPQYASRGLKMIEYPVNDTIEIEPKLEEQDDQIISVLAVKKTGSDMIDPDCTSKLRLESNTISFTAKDHDNWSVLVFVETYSKGTIRGIHFGEDDGQPNAPASADLLNPEAVKTFIEFTHQRYYQVLKPYFGNTIIGMFTDEPAILGRRAQRGLRPWTKSFLESYIDYGGSEQDLAVLWFKAGEQTEVKRKKFKQAINKKLEQSYYKQISEWCTNHGIALTGHPEASDEIGLLKYFHIPGQDVVWRWVAPENELGITGAHSTMAKCSSDAARHLGVRRNANECFACCGANRIEWAFNVWDMKWYMDWLFVRGVNLLYPHAFFYSIDGEGRYNERPPDVGPHNIWWSYYQQISTYIKRMSWLMTDCVNQAQVAVLCEPDYLPWQIVRPLYEHQIEFNYLENRLFDSQVDIDNDTFTIHSQKYSVLIVEDANHITDEVLKKLQLGGTVIIWRTDQSSCRPKNAVYIQEPIELVEIINRVNKPDIVAMPANDRLRFSHVVKEGIHFYVLVNEGDQVINSQVSLATIGYGQIWNAWNGTLRQLNINSVENGYMLTDLCLQGRESAIIVIDPMRKPELHSQEHYRHNRRDKNVIEDLSQGWQITDSPIKLDVENKLRSWTEFDQMTNFSGTLTYTREFTLSNLNDQTCMWLDLGKVGEIVVVTVNDHKVGVALMPPYRFDISRFVNNGRNSIRLAVTNSLANKFTDAHLESGLLGPVKLLKGACSYGL